MKYSIKYEGTEVARSPFPPHDIALAASTDHPAPFYVSAGTLIIAIARKGRWLYRADRSPCATKA